MKRTLTAAATLLVSSAGAVGFAGTAAAAEAPELPTQLPVDNGVAQTAYHAVGTVHSATTMVGEVVPMQEQPTSRSGGESGGPLGGPLGDLAGSGNSVGGLTGGTGGNSPLGGLTGGLTGSGSPLSSVLG